MKCKTVEKPIRGLAACRCGANGAQVLREIKPRWWERLFLGLRYRCELYCNSCGGGDCEFYGHSTNEVIMKWNLSMTKAKAND